MSWSSVSSLTPWRAKMRSQGKSKPLFKRKRIRVLRTSIQVSEIMNVIKF